jgi:hypothetical protein
VETAYQTKVPANMLEPEGLPKATPAATASATDAPVAAEEAPAAKETPAAKEAPADDATADEPTSSDGEGDSGPVEPAGGFWERRCRVLVARSRSTGRPYGPQVLGAVSRWDGFE